MKTAPPQAGQTFHSSVDFQAYNPLGCGAGTHSPHSTEPAPQGEKGFAGGHGDLHLSFRAGLWKEARQTQLRAQLEASADQSSQLGSTSFLKGDLEGIFHLPPPIWFWAWQPEQEPSTWLGSGFHLLGFSWLVSGGVAPGGPYQTLPARFGDSHGSHVRADLPYLHVSLALSAQRILRRGHHPLLGPPGLGLPGALSVAHWGNLAWGWPHGTQCTPAATGSIMAFRNGALPIPHPFQPSSILGSGNVMR